MHDYTRLDVYHQAIKFTKNVFDVTRNLPSEYRYSLASQLERSALSVPPNIAEGAGRGDRRDFARFLRIAIGSVCEADSQLHVCEVARLAPPRALAHLRGEAISIRKRLHRLEQSLQP